MGLSGRFITALLGAGVIFAGCGGGGGGAAPPAVTHPSGTIVEFALPTALANPTSIVAGPDGALWFLESLGTGSKLGKINISGGFSEFPMPAGVSAPNDLINGPDGDFWYIDGAGHLGSADVNGLFSALFTATNAAGLTVGADNNFWVPELSTNLIDVYNTSGTLLHTYPTGYSAQLGEALLATDGNVWLGATVGATLGKITPAGVVTTVALGNSGGLRGLTNGPDRNIWITGDLASVFKVTTAGVLAATLTLPTNPATPRGITSGPDGNLWVAEMTGNKIARVTPGGTITEFTIPTANSQPVGITRGPDGNVWFTEAAGNKIGYIVP
jgi:streptogramin lyase